MLTGQNKPIYIIVDVFGEIVANTLAALQAADARWTNLNYQFGYVTELNDTLQNMNKMDSQAVKKYPLVWLTQPFVVTRDEKGSFYGDSIFRLFIISPTKLNWKAKDRMDNNFKPIIYPIYLELLNQIDLHLAFTTQSQIQIPHDFTDRYYWGEQQQHVLGDMVDCSEISKMKLTINFNYRQTNNFL